MSIRSIVDLLPLAQGLSFDVSINIPDFREVQFLFVQQDDWWMLSIDGGNAFRLATFTNYNINNYISDDLDFLFQLRPKNIVNQTVEIDDIGEFYIVFISGDDFDDRPPRVEDPSYIYSDAPIPFQDTLLDPLPEGITPYAYFTFSTILHDNLDVTGWANNLDAENWEIASDTEIQINSDFNINSVYTVDNSVVKSQSTALHDDESAPTVFLVIKPDLVSIGTTYNLLQLGTDNDVHIAIEQIDPTTMEYSCSRGLTATIQGDYTAGQLIGIMVEMNKSVAEYQTLRISTGETAGIVNDNAATPEGEWGFFANNGRDQARTEILEAIILPPEQLIAEKNRIMSYLNNKYGLEFVLIE